MIWLLIRFLFIKLDFKMLYLNYVKCVSGRDSLTVGNVYHILNDNDKSYCIIDDDWDIANYGKSYFKKCDINWNIIEKKEPKFRIWEKVAMKLDYEDVEYIIIKTIRYHTTLNEYTYCIEWRCEIKEEYLRSTTDYERGTFYLS